MKRALLAALLLSTAFPCAAAEITVHGDKLFILGAIEFDDDTAFAELAKPYQGKPMTVVLHSGGGQIAPSLPIGALIRRYGWTTVVPYTCNSACALIWLGGAKLTKVELAEIGFHAAHNGYGEATEIGNWMTTTYLLRMGYTREFAEWSLVPPKEMIYLSLDWAKKLGVQVVPQTYPKFINVNLRAQPKPGTEAQLKHWSKEFVEYDREFRPVISAPIPTPKPKPVQTVPVTTAADPWAGMTIVPPTSFEERWLHQIK